MSNGILKKLAMAFVGTAVMVLSAEAEITSNPVWQNLDAVRNDRVYEVSDDVWMFGIGYAAANEVLDDLDETIGDQDAA